MILDVVSEAHYFASQGGKALFPDPEVVHRVLHCGSQLGRLVISCLDVRYGGNILLEKGYLHGLGRVIVSICLYGVGPNAPGPSATPIV